MTITGKGVLNTVSSLLGISALITLLTPQETLARDARYETCREGFFEEVYIPPGQTKIYNPPLVSPVSEAPGVLVSVDGFCASVNEVSFLDYRRCVEDGGCNEIEDARGHPDHPVHSISIKQVQDFLNWVSVKSGHTYRLPTEAEWQHAASGGIHETYPWRFISDKHQPNIFSEAVRKTGVSAPNGFGLRDAIGNLAEYVSDCYTEDLELIPNNGLPYVENDCQRGVAKGGNFLSAPYALSPYFRFPYSYNIKSHLTGFRPVRNITGEK